MNDIVHQRVRIDPLQAGGDRAEREKTLIEIIEGLRSAIERAREAGLVDLVFQLSTVLADAERELASLTKLNRRARAAAARAARRRGRAAPPSRAR